MIHQAPTPQNKKETHMRAFLIPATVVLIVAIGGIGRAQHDTHGSDKLDAAQPYAGHQSRPIKALSDDQLADLKAGRGMSLALPAELNGYPGPLHVIELADALGLSQEQRVRMQQLFEAMRDEAIALGHQLIEKEAALEGLFATRTVTQSTLAQTTTSIGQTQAELRATHLRYHLLTTDVLTHDQMQRYAELRGYSSVEPELGHQPQHRH